LAGLGDGGCGGCAARLGVHIVLGINVGSLLGEALNRSCLVIAHTKVERSPPLCTGGGRLYEDSGQNDRQERSGMSGRRRNLMQHWRVRLLWGCWGAWGCGGVGGLGRCRDVRLLAWRWRGCGDDGRVSSDGAMRPRGE
jgi:hypothetical protein